MRGLLLAVMMAAVASSALADETPIVDVPAGFSWTGAYVGVQGGYVWGSSVFKRSGGFYADYKPKGWIGGVYAGYNHQLSNRLVLGFEADIHGGSVDDNSHWRIPGNAVLPGFDAPVNQKWAASARGRVGYAVDRFLPYLTAGVAVSRFEHGTRNLVSGASIMAPADNHTGWTVGGGVDWAITDKLVARAEYRYSDYGLKRSGVPGIFPAHKVGFSTSDVRIGLAYKF